MLGWVNRTGPRNLGETLGQPLLESFLELSKTHRDGWGFAAYLEDGRRAEIHGLESAWSDPRLEALLSQPTTHGLIHLRWASPGMAVSERNSHPFLSENLAFCHNGYLPDLKSVMKLLTPEFRQKLAGQTDSETYFTLVRQAISLGLDPRSALASTTLKLHELFPLASLNCLFLTPQGLYAVSESRAAFIKHALGINQEFGSKVPCEHGCTYYRLYRRFDGQSSVVVSSGLGLKDWSCVPEETLVSLMRTGSPFEDLDLRS